MSKSRPPTRLDLMNRFGPGDHAMVIDGVLDLIPRGPDHQPRVAGGTRVKVVSATGNPDDPVPLFRVQVLEERGQPTRYWAIVSGANLTEAPALSWLERLRHRAA